jgi:nucleoid DNA-binding protein
VGIDTAPHAHYDKAVEGLPLKSSSDGRFFYSISHPAPSSGRSAEVRLFCQLSLHRESGAGFERDGFIPGRGGEERAGELTAWNAWLGQPPATLSRCAAGWNDPVNKDDLSKAVYEIHGGMSYADAQKTVDFILDTIKSRLVRGEKVLLSGFGCFRVVVRRDRKGINPKTRESIVIPGRKAIRFKPSKYLKSV